MYKLRKEIVFLIVILAYILVPLPPLADATPATTIVGGRISRDTIWTQKNNPYVLEDNLVIPQGICLTIEEGVTIDFTLWSIIVEGELRATGTFNNKIIFNISLPPLEDNKKARIYFTPESRPYKENNQGCMIEHTRIVCADYSISHGVIHANRLKLDHVEIIGGLSHWKQYAVKTNGTITNCLFDGVYMAILMRDGTITKNTFLNTRHGTVIDIRNGLVKDNIFDEGKRAIRVQNATIVGNTIMNMEYVGINAQSDETPYPYGKLKPMIANNIIVRCDDAIKIWGDVRPIVTNNLILENSRGLSFEFNAFYGGVKPRIEYNAFHNNDYNVYVYREDPRIEVSLDNNWWGTDDTGIIEEKIYDEEDNPRLSKVLYEPRLTEPPRFLPKVAYQLSASTNRQVVEITETVVVSGTVVPSLKTVDIIIACAGPGGKQTQAMVRTIKDGSFSYEFTPSSVGAWTINVEPQEEELFKNSVIGLGVYVTEMSSEVDISVTPKICYEGDDITMQGAVTPALQNELIQFKVLNPDGSTLDGYSTTDSQGAFTYILNAVASGNYQATVFWQGTQDHQSSTATLSFRVHKPSQITVMIEDEEGRPVENANIQSIAPPFGQSNVTGISDSRGTVVFSNMIYGSYNFNVEKTGYEPVNITAQLSEGETSTIECVLTEKGVIPTTISPGTVDDSSYSSDPWYLWFTPSLITIITLLMLYMILHKLRTR